MIKKRYILSAIFGGLAGLVSCFPLAWVGGMIPQQNLPAPLVFSGTVWKGQVSGIPLTGPVTIKTGPRDLFGGTPIGIEGSGPSIYVKGRLGPKQIRDLRFQGELSDLPITDGRLVGLAGTVYVNLEAAQIRDKACQSASGTARTDVLARNRARMQWQGPELSGPISCEDGNIRARLAGQDNMSDIEADLTILLGGQYRMDMMVKSRDSRAGAVLPLFGFQPADGGFRLTEQGQW